MLARKCVPELKQRFEPENQETFNKVLSVARTYFGFFSHFQKPEAETMCAFEQIFLGGMDESKTMAC